MPENNPEAYKTNGGVAPPLGAEAEQAVAPEQPSGQDQIVVMLEQYAQSKDAELAVQIADMLLVEMGVAQPQESPSIQEAPATPPPLEGQTPEGVPALAKGGKISALDQYSDSKKK